MRSHSCNGPRCMLAALGCLLLLTPTIQALGVAIGDRCVSGAYCNFPGGSCTAGMKGGVCTVQPEVCNDLMDPVCGCDGQTYSNQCWAALAGVSIESTGECGADGEATTTAADITTTGGDTSASSNKCGGPLDVQCPSGLICLYDAASACGDNGAYGLCQSMDKEMVCTQDVDYVCGCDGKTYPSACEAQSLNGVSVRSKGQCPSDGVAIGEARSCGNPGDKKCPMNHFCEVDVGGCAQLEPITAGTCIQQPLTCPSIIYPVGTLVCGCDSTTYKSSCLAQKAGVSIMYYGACFSDAITTDPNLVKCGNQLGNTCKTDGSEYCKYQQGICGLYNSAGACSTIPDSCTEDIDRVCGCDGITYNNECKAMQKGVSITSAGACTSSSAAPAFSTNLNTSSQASCSPSEPCVGVTYCSYDLGDCGEQKGSTGLCLPQPPMCTTADTSLTTVCGCDGKTYGSECAAAVAGVSLQSGSTCAAKSQPTTMSSSAPPTYSTMLLTVLLMLAGLMVSVARSF